MQLSHSFVVPAAFDVTWSAFSDLEGLVPCFPGATLISVDGDTFTGSVKVKLGPISMVYNGTGVFVERDEATGRIVVQAKGKDKHGNGTAGAAVVAQVSPTEAGTAVEVTTDLSVTGKPAQFGRGVIQDISDKLLGQFVDCIAAKLGPDPAGDAATGIEVAESMPAPSESAEEGPSARLEGEVVGSPVPPPATTPAGGDHATVAAKPAELNLLSTVLPVLIRRYALPTVIVLAVIIGIWVWAPR